MDQQSDLITHFENYLALTDTEKSMIRDRVTVKELKRREYILRMGELCKHYTFVSRGILRMFVVDMDGKENNVLFSGEGDWVADISSFHSARPARSSIQSLEKSLVMQIERNDLYFLYTEIPKLDRIFKVIIENKYVELQDRVVQSLSLTAEDRYLNFLDHYPKLASKLPNTQIASYLGITPEFLSFIRKDLSRKKK